MKQETLKTSSLITLKKMILKHEIMVKHNENKKETAEHHDSDYVVNDWSFIKKAIGILPDNLLSYFQELLKSDFFRNVPDLQMRYQLCLQRTLEYAKDIGFEEYKSFETHTEIPAKYYPTDEQLKALDSDNWEALKNDPQEMESLAILNMIDDYQIPPGWIHTVRCRHCGVVPTQFEWSKDKVLDGCPFCFILLQQGKNFT